jgi:hypothetical protein
MVEMERLDRRAKTLRAGSRDGVAFLAHAAGERPRERMPEQAPNLGAVSGQQGRAQAIQVIEHRALRIRPK